MNQKTYQALLEKVCEAGLAYDDIVLFLDTHPDCREALNYYDRAVCAYGEAVNEYQKEIGPLTASHASCEDSFSWICDPWPWEGGN